MYHILRTASDLLAGDFIRGIGIYIGDSRGGVFETKKKRAWRSFTKILNDIEKSKWRITMVTFRCLMSHSVL